MSRAPLPAGAEEAIWRGLLVLGALLAVLGALDMAVLWLPTNLGAPEWGFGTVSTSFDTFPQFGLGIALLLAASVALGLRWTTRWLAIVCLLTSMLLWLAGFLYLTSLPFMFQVNAAPSVRFHVEKATAKTALQALVYPLLLLLLALRGWRVTLARADAEVTE
jgi:hypothetical protein